MELVKRANMSKVGQDMTEHKMELHKDLHNDSSSEDTVSTSESPDFTEMSESITSDK